MERFTRKELIIFIVIFLLGVFLRLYRLDYPLGLHGDEAWSGIEAQRILQDGSIGVWSPSALGQPTLPFYWTAFIFKIFGINIFTLRFSFALLSILSLPFFYLATRLLFSKDTALVAFFLFAVARIPLHFSHIAYMAYLTPFFIAVFFFLLALKHNKTPYFIISGFCMGISLYFYVGLRILPVLFLLFIIYKSFHRNFLNQYLKNIVIFFITGLIIFIPLGQYATLHRADFMSRTNSVSIFSTQGLQQARTSIYGEAELLQIIYGQIKTTALMFNIKGDGDSQDNYQNLPVFDSVTGAFFILGFIISLRKIRSESVIFLSFWFFTFLLGTILTVDAPNFRRIQPSIAASYIFSAIGIIWVYEILKNRLKNHIFLPVLLTILLTFVMWKNITLYFTKQAVSSETKHTFSYPLVKAAEFLNTLPDTQFLYFYSSSWSYDYETMRFLAPHIQGENRSSQFGKYSLINTHPDKKVVYLFLDNYLGSIDVIRDLYPNGKVIVNKDSNGNRNIIFNAYLLPNN